MKMCLLGISEYFLEYLEELLEVATQAFGQVDHLHSPLILAAIDI